MKVRIKRYDDGIHVLRPSKNLFVKRPRKPQFANVSAIVPKVAEPLGGFAGKPLIEKKALDR